MATHDKDVAAGTAIALTPGMASDSVDLRVRVILVTTRAALRHADGDPGQHRAIILRGRGLLDALRADLDDGAEAAIDRGHAELDELEPL